MYPDRGSAVNDGGTGRFLEKEVRFFTRDTGIMTGLSVACGEGEKTVTAMDGDVTERTVFDLASLTKLFTGLTVMRLAEEGLLDPDRRVASYETRFVHLNDVTVRQILSFCVNLQTPGRIDACGNRDDAEQCLFAVENRGAPGRRAYSDIPAMVLKYVIEAASGLPLYDCVRSRILIPAGMYETWSVVPEERRMDCQFYSPEYRLENGRYICVG